MVLKTGAVGGKSSANRGKATRKRRRKPSSKADGETENTADEAGASQIAVDSSASGLTQLDVGEVSRRPLRPGEAHPVPADGNLTETASKPKKAAKRSGRTSGRSSRSKRKSRAKRGDRSDEQPKDADDSPVVPKDETGTTTKAGTSRRASRADVDATKALNETKPGAAAETETKPARPAKSRGKRRGGRGSAKMDTKPSEDPSVTPEQSDLPDETPISSGTITGARRGREMVINVSAEDECRIAVLNDGRLEDLFIERKATQSHVGNIYKGLVTNVEPSIQAVFVDFGLTKNGFLHISDVQPQYFPDHSGEPEDVGRKIPRHNRPAIQKCFRRGQEVIVQVTKEGVGTKGPTLTTYLSIAGRFLVMMPGMNRHGVSRKIEDESDRREMRQLLNQLTLPPGMGFILRTAGLGQSKRELQRDLSYLTRLWKRVVERIKRLPAPADLYQESDLVKRTIRDVYTGDFARLIVDDAETAQKAREFLKIAMPRSKAAIEVYSEREPLFHRLGIEDEIDRIHARHVPLPLGGSIVIDSTEALVAIDVNSGRFRSVEDAEESAYRINLEAADEIARQLRLRDLGGLIICDFIDMRLDRNKRGVERALRNALKRHKEHARALRMSSFGLIELTRQRRGPSYKRNIFFDCPHCKGAGVVKMPESVTLDVMRFVQLATHNEQVQTVKVSVASDVAFQILNNKRAMINQIEQETGKQVIIRGEPGFTSDQVEYACEDTQGRLVPLGQANSEESSTSRGADKGSGKTS